jgi:hypothetical protein
MNNDTSDGGATVPCISLEAGRRVFDFEKVCGVTPASVRYESHGKAMDKHNGDFDKK